MTTELALREAPLAPNPAGLGSRDAIAAVRQRILTMMPGASEAPEDVQWAAAQLAVAYRLDPFNGEIYIMKIGRKKVNERWVDEYRAHVGIKGLRKKAREQAQFMTRFKELSPDEVKAYRRDQYDPGDIGIECEVWRLDIAGQCARWGIPYEPFRAVGFWRVKAKWDKQGGQWEPDNIPNTWTAREVAEKRAEINAIKRAYDLTIQVADPALIEDDETAEVLGQRLQRMDEADQLVNRPDLGREVDGDVLYDQPDAEPSPAGQGAPEPVDLLADGTLHPAVFDFVAALRGQEKPGAKKATERQHGYAAGVIDAITGTDTHGLVFHALFGRPVSNDKDNRLAAGAADLIFRWLLAEKTVKDERGQTVYEGKQAKKEANPEYRPEYVEFVGIVYNWACEWLT